MKKRISIAFTIAVAIAAAGLLSGCAMLGGHASKKHVDHAKPKTRLDDIRRAQVWAPTDIPSMDLRIGPKGHGAFAPDETVTCSYVQKEMTGRSPKFTCKIPPDDEVKVKYGKDNGEVYAEVAATRLFWAIGFPVDRMYPVRVVCSGCPEAGGAVRDDASGAFVFDPASIERKLAGRVIETSPDSGWAWGDLDKVDEAAGGAPPAQREALKLLAVFVQHSDNKAEQQRLLCEDEKAKDEKAKDEKAKDEQRICGHPVMMVNDLGMTFGHSTLFNRNIPGSANLPQWLSAHIWTSDAAHCVGDLQASETGSLEHPVIHEAGRKFLSDLLMQLSDKQLRDLFEVSRFGERAPGSKEPASVDAWVNAFKTKRGEIANRTCPA